MSRSQSAAIGVLLLLAGILVPALADGSALVVHAPSCMSAAGGVSRVVPPVRTAELCDDGMIVESPHPHSNSSRGNAVPVAVAASRPPLHCLLRVYLI